MALAGEPAPGPTGRARPALLRGPQRRADRRRAGLRRVDDPRARLPRPRASAGHQSPLWTNRSRVMSLDADLREKFQAYADGAPGNPELLATVLRRSRRRRHRRWA